MQSPWSRKWFGKRRGERHRDYEDRLICYAVYATLLLLCFLSGVMLGWWQGHKVKPPVTKDSIGAARHQYYMPK